MKHKHPYFSVFLFLSFSLGACSQDSAKTPVAVVIQHSYTLGSTLLTVNHTTYRSSSPIKLVQLHHNELTADSVTQTISEEMGIDYLQIINGEKRLIDFATEGKNHRFDPNRMFSTEGIVNSLQLHSQYSEAGFQSIASFRNSLLNLLGSNSTIIAVHNNTDGAFALADYMKNNTGQVHQNTTLDPDDFFITTDSLLFSRLKERDFNVVLEYSERLIDDGSLSIYCSRNKIPYVNVEAQHGHREEQAKMLRTLTELLK